MQHFAVLRSRGNLAQLNLPSDSEWPRLQSLVLKLFISRASSTGNILQATELLTDLRRRTSLWEVRIELHDIMSGVGVSFGTDIYVELERALLAFSCPRITWIIGDLRAGRQSFWTQEFGKCFPALFQRGLVAVMPPERGKHCYAFINIAKLFSFSSLAHPEFLTGHEDTLWDLVVSPDSRWIASGSKDGTIIVWSVSDGEIAQQWVAHHYAPVMSLAFSPDSQSLVSGGRNGEVVIWDISEGSLHEVVGVLKGHVEPVTCCAWSPCGNVIASESQDESVRLWDTRTFHQLRTLGPLFASDTIRRVEFSPNGRWLLSMSDLYFDQPIWNVVSGTLHQSLLQPDDAQRLNDMLDLRLSTAPGSGSDPVAGIAQSLAEILQWDNVDSSAATVWNVETGRKLFGLGEIDNPSDLASSCDGKLVLRQTSLAGDYVVKVWDVSMGVELCSLKEYTIGSIWCARFSPRGEYIAIASAKDHKVRVWRTTDGSSIGTFSEYASPADHLVFSMDGKTLASGSGGLLTIGRVCDIIPRDEHQGL